MKVKNEIQIHTLNGTNTKVGDNKNLLVENVWNAKKLISLEFEGNKISVLAEDLRRAIDNSININD